MKLPALAISLLVRELGEPWEFVALARGMPMHRGSGFDSPREAFAAAIAGLCDELKGEIEARERPN